MNFGDWGWMNHVVITDIEQISSDNKMLRIVTL